MKKAIKIVSILTLIIVLVSAVFVASGCGEEGPSKPFGTALTIYDHYYNDTGDSMRVELGGYYQDGEVVITSARVYDNATHALWEKKWGDASSLGYSRLKYDKKDGGFHKMSIALVLEKQGIVGKDIVDRFADYTNQDTLKISVLIKADDKYDFHSGSEVVVQARIRGMFTGTGYVR